MIGLSINFKDRWTRLIDDLMSCVRETEKLRMKPRFVAQITRRLEGKTVKFRVQVQG